MQDTTRLPFQGSFFIVGAPRCGTTSLSKTLAAHPQVCFSKPKETHFFARVAADTPAARLREEFLRRHFPGQDVSDRFVGEGSVSTLYAPEALRRIQRFDPHARFLVAVRNPVDMISSYHARLLYSLDEDEQDFSRAWALQAPRSEGRQLPRRCRDPRLLQYGDVGRLGQHVERLFDTVGRDNCLVVVLDDVKQRNAELYREVLEFIGLADDGREGFVHKNENRAYKSRWLQQFVMNPPPWIARLIMARESKGQDRMRMLRRLRKRIKRKNNITVQRPQLDSGLRAELHAYFEADIQRLSRLLDRDLSHWH